MKTIDLLVDKTKFEQAKYKDLVQIKCSVCDTIVNREKRKIKNSLLYGSGIGYRCSSKCAGISKNSTMTYNCTQCSNLFTRSMCEVKNKSFLFCSHSCSALFYNAKRRALKPIKKHVRRVPLANYTLVCVDCLKAFIVKGRKAAETRIYCSKNCSIKNNYHPNSTIVHRCMYKGTKMDSGAEKIFAEQLDLRNIKWLKNTTKFYPYQYNNKNKKYYPDFYLTDLKMWIEIKGKRYVEPWLPNKIGAVKAANEQILLIDSKELKHFDILLNKIETHSKLAP